MDVTTSVKMSEGFWTRLTAIVEAAVDRCLEKRFPGLAQGVAYNLSLAEGCDSRQDVYRGYQNGEMLLGQEEGEELVSGAISRDVNGDDLAGVAAADSLPGLSSMRGISSVGDEVTCDGDPATTAVLSDQVSTVQLEQTGLPSHEKEITNLLPRNFLGLPKAPLTPAYYFFCRQVMRYVFIDKL